MCQFKNKFRYAQFLCQMNYLSLLAAVILSLSKSIYLMYFHFYDTRFLRLFAYSKFLYHLPIVYGRKLPASILPCIIPIIQA
jgi:hypothetical protein